MSNDMNNEHDKAEEQSLQDKLSRAYKSASEETTSSQLDASIMAMAQQEVDARDKDAANKSHQKKSWWDRLKMPVSISAALVVTVGIARFMVELGYHDPNSVAQSENYVPSYERSTEIVLRDDAFTPKSDVAEVAVAEKKQVRAAKSEARAKLVKQREQVESVTVTGARIRTENVERSRQLAADERRLAESEMVKMQRLEPQEELQEEQSQVALASEPAPEDDENQAVSALSDSETGHRDAVDTPYLPAAEWLQQIKSLLEEGNHDAAKQQWLKFKQVYPDYSIEKTLYQRLESL